MAEALSPEDAVDVVTDAIKNADVRTRLTTAEWVLERQDQVNG